MVPRSLDQRCSRIDLSSLWLLVRSRFLVKTNAKNQDAVKMVRRSDSPSDSRFLFELSCNGNHINILFPESVKFFVTKINYKSRQIDVYDPNNCLVSQVLKIHGFSNSPFYYVNHKVDSSSFFKCSTKSENGVFNYRCISCAGRATKFLPFHRIQILNTCP